MRMGDWISDVCSSDLQSQKASRIRGLWRTRSDHHYRLWPASLREFPRGSGSLRLLRENFQNFSSGLGIGARVPHRSWMTSTSPEFAGNLTPSPLQISTLDRKSTRLNSSH